MSIDKAILGIFILLILILSGCTAELGKTSKIWSESEDSQQIYDSIQQGMTKEEVKSIAGEPLDTQIMESADMELEYWYYAGKIQIGFMNGVVNTKSKY